MAAKYWNYQIARTLLSWLQGDELIAVLIKLKDTVLAGELDAQFETTRGALRAGFGR